MKDAGSAIGTGTDVAIETADNTLIAGFLAVIAAIRLSRATKRDIPQNLCWPWPLRRRFGV
jgi:Cu+-exporting ATPase